MAIELWLVTLGGLASLNFEGIRRFRSWSARGQGHLFDDLRHNLDAAFLSKNRTQAT